MLKFGGRSAAALLRLLLESVKVWDTDGAESDWSPVASWRTEGCSTSSTGRGVVSSRFAGSAATAGSHKVEPADRAENWFMEDNAAVYMPPAGGRPRRSRRATAFICGLGYYGLYINGGRKVGDQILDPLFC